jgi:hypothetical protein
MRGHHVGRVFVFSGIALALFRLRATVISSFSFPLRELGLAHVFSGQRGGVLRVFCEQV